MDKEMQKASQYKLKYVRFTKALGDMNMKFTETLLRINAQLAYQIRINKRIQLLQQRYSNLLSSERGDVPGWVLVVLMTTGLVTAIWTIAAPRLTSILKNSLAAMNGIR
jgi:hypothetical protein